MRRKVNYTEGNCFTVPLESGGFAFGVVARMNGKGGIFGYFFGPRLQTTKDIEKIYFDPSNPVLWGRFSHLGLVTDKWTVIGKIDNWSRDDWPMPPFVKCDGDKCFIRTHDDDTLEFLSEEKVARGQILEDDYPPDGAMGDVYVEKRLDKLLD